MNDLLRELAPISQAAWDEIDDTVRATLKARLAARRLVDLVGPLGWPASSVSLGRTSVLRTPPVPGVNARLRSVLPLVELRVPFELDRAELEAIGRGGKDAELGPAIAAAQAMAMAEDRVVLQGYDGGAIRGIAQASAGAAVTISDDYHDYPAAVAEALEILRGAGIEGPHAIALGPRCYRGLSATTSGGYPVFEHVRRLIDGPLVSAPAVDGAIVLSLRGGDFELTVGQDLSVGYLDHGAKTVSLYIQETLTFRVLAPEAAVPLIYAPSAARARRRGRGRTRS